MRIVSIMQELIAVTAVNVEGTMKKNKKKEVTMSMRNRRLQVSLLGLLVCSGVRADLIVGYDFSFASTAPSSIHSGISTSNVQLAGGWGAASSSGTLFISNPTNVPTAAINLAQYVSFVINPLLENVINYDSVSFRLGGDNTTASTDCTFTLELRSSLDNYTSVLGTTSYTALRSSGQLNFAAAATIDLSGVTSFQEVDSATTFHLYAYDNSNVNTTKIVMRLDDIAVYGTVIPEPATIGMLGLGMLIVLGVRRART